MRAAVITKFGSPTEAFEIQELPDPIPADNEVVIDVTAFGLNFADVQARMGKYRECPPLPAVVGYEVVGHISAVGKDADFEIGQRVAAFSRFGGYATKVATQATATVAISDSLPEGVALATMVQYSTAYYMMEMAIPVWEGDSVLIHAAAGGVGTALTQMAKLKNCTIYGTVSTTEKANYAKSQGVDYPIIYTQDNFAEVISKISPDGKVDVVFDAVGAKSVKQGMKLLRPGGRFVCFGAATFASTGKWLLPNLRAFLQFGFYHPAPLMMGNKSLVGVNMLKVGDTQPKVLRKCLEGVAALAEAGKIKPVIGGTFSIDQLAEAHEFLQSRKSMGKVFVKW